MFPMKIIPVADRRAGRRDMLSDIGVDDGSHPCATMSKSDIGCRGRTTISCNSIIEGNHRAMPAITIVYWRDIPAQVIVGTGRRASKIQLSERFEQAIDRCAMKVGAKDADAYLAEWRKAPPAEVEGEPEAVAAAEAARLEAEFDTARLKSLIESDGWARTA
jgi:hypothetical protein